MKAYGFQPLHSVYLSSIPDEEIGGHDGAEKLAESNAFKELDVGIVLDEGEILIALKSCVMGICYFIAIVMITVFGEQVWCRRMRITGHFMQRGAHGGW